VRQLELTLAAWSADDHLTGADNAATRSTLRDAAEAVDHARAAMRSDAGTAYSLARCVATYSELLRAAAPSWQSLASVDVWSAIGGDAQIHN
jgi:hypothetical protein